jgi:putative hemolysin
LIALLWLLIALLAGLLVLVSFVQILYLESQRLRPRDLPALDVFKERWEDEFGLRLERGVLSFSLIKHSLILLLGVAMFAALCWGRAPSPMTLAEVSVAAWIAMMAAAYVLPQALYRRTQGAWLSPFMPPLKALALLARPLVAPLEIIQSLMDTAEEKAAQEEAITSTEAVEALLEAGAEEGLIEEEDRKLLQSVVEFGDKTVREVMTPRPEIVAIRASAGLEELRQLVIHEQFSRIPVYETTIDDIIGYVHVRDMFELDEESRRSKTVRELARPVRFVPETKPVNDLLREMQEKNTHLVIVVDEYGNTAGLASMEDLVEVIVGEIRDEHEPATDIAREEDGACVVSGSFDVSRLDELFEVRLSGEPESTTVGGLVSEWLGHVPQPGEVVEKNGLRIEVLASNGLRVESVRLRAAPAVKHDGNN